MSIAEQHDCSHACTANKCGNSEEICSGRSELVKPWKHADDPGMNGNSRSQHIRQQESRFDKNSDIYKPDGLQELLQFAREFELEEAMQGVSHNKSHAHTEGAKKEGDWTELNLFSGSNLKESFDKRKECTEVLCQGESRSTNCALEGNDNHKRGVEVSCLEGSRSRSCALEKKMSSSFSLSDEISDVKDKNALGQGRSLDVAVSHKGLGSNGIFQDADLRTPEVPTARGSKLLVVEKALCSECVRNHEDSFKELSNHATQEYHDEDAMSSSSMKSCSPARKAKARQFTSANSFNFHTDSRAEKRKEYYVKRQERQIAKEKEMNQLQAKAKKEREEEIKLLRKSLTYKAHPVPSFYQEGPPQKAELPKTPTTRAKSPNFSRRETSFKGSTRFCSFKCEADHRNSFSPKKPANGSNMDSFDHGNCCKKSFERKSSSKLSDWSSDGINPDVVSELHSELSVTSSEVADIHVKVQDSLIVSSEVTTSAEDENIHLDQMHAASNGNMKVYHDGVAKMKL